MTANGRRSHAGCTATVTAAPHCVRSASATPLYAWYPVCQGMLKAGGGSLLTSKAASPKTRYEYLDGIRPTTRRAINGIGCRRPVHRCRRTVDLSNREGDDARRVNRLLIVSPNPDSTVIYRGAFVTSLDVDHGNVAVLADCTRARWRIENETLNVLKQHGFHLEQSFSHGKHTLATMLVVLARLVFALHTACELAKSLWQRACRRPGTRRRLFELRCILAEYPVSPPVTPAPSLSPPVAPPRSDPGAHRATPDADSANPEEPREPIQSVAQMRTAGMQRAVAMSHVGNATGSRPDTHGVSEVIGFDLFDSHRPVAHDSDL